MKYVSLKFKVVLMLVANKWINNVSNMHISSIRETIFHSSSVVTLRRQTSVVFNKRPQELVRYTHGYMYYIFYSCFVFESGETLLKSQTSECQSQRSRTTCYKFIFVVYFHILGSECSSLQESTSMPVRYVCFTFPILFPCHSLVRACCNDQRQWGIQIYYVFHAIFIGCILLCVSDIYNRS
jgi:hypothetical protein